MQNMQWVWSLNIQNTYVSYNVHNLEWNLKRYMSCYKNVLKIPWFYSFVCMTMIVVF